MASASNSNELSSSGSNASTSIALKAELKDHITHYLFEQTQRSPIVIPVINVISSKGESAKTVHQSKTKSAEEVAVDQQKRFQEMRARLLGQDQPD